MSIAGESEASIRLLSSAFHLAAVCLLIGMGRKLVGAPGALVAAMVWAYSPLALFHAHWARMYAMLGCVTVAAGLIFLGQLVDGAGQKVAARLLPDDVRYQHRTDIRHR